MWGRIAFHERKDSRREHYYRFVYGWKERACTACNGSGHYDHNGSPPCGGCEGTGREKYRGPKAMTPEEWESIKRGEENERFQELTKVDRV